MALLLFPLSGLCPPAGGYGAVGSPCVWGRALVGPGEMLGVLMGLVPHAAFLLIHGRYAICG